MKDHHVDRPGVEVGQPMKLTGSDRPNDSDPVATDQLSVSSRQFSEATDKATTEPHNHRRHVTHQNLTNRPPGHRRVASVVNGLKTDD